MRQAKTAADEAAIAKQPPHILGQRVGCHIEILRSQAKQQIAHGAAHQKRLISPSLSRYSTFRALGEIEARDIECSDEE